MKDQGVKESAAEMYLRIKAQRRQFNTMWNTVVCGDSFRLGVDPRNWKGSKAHKRRQREKAVSWKGKRRRAWN